MAFEFLQKVVFRHCDPAGIVFFPRYFEMMNDCVEAFFDEVLNTPFEEFLKTGGVPTAEISTRFVAPSRHGDKLALTLHVMHVGRSSMQYRMEGRCRGTLRFETTATLVNVSLDGRPAPWVDATRQKLEMQKDAPA